MALAIVQTAFILPSGPEMFVILVVGIMLFGRRLPDVGRTVGRTVVQLRQGFNKLKADIALEDDLRGVTDVFRETRNDLTRHAEIPRALANPGRLLDDLTDETLATPGPPEKVSSDNHGDEVPLSIFDPPTDPGTPRTNPS